MGHIIWTISYFNSILNIVSLDPKIQRWYYDSDEIKMTVSPSMFAGNIFDSNPRTYAPNNQDNPGYVFEAEKIINFKSLVMMKRFDGMRDRYQGMISIL